MMSNEEFVDTHVDDLATKVPRLLQEYPESPKFLRVLADLANVIVETAAVLGDDAKAYAERKVGVMVLSWVPALRVVASTEPPPNPE